MAAPTTSLPEWPGSVRNWDYRYCWLRDATFTLYSLMTAGYVKEAVEWRDWLLRAVAGDPAHLQIMYGTRGERRLTEYEVDWLPGYEKSAPVRVGNAASQQFQLDVYGEVVRLAAPDAPDERAREIRTPGRCSAPSSSSSRRRGRIPTRASGKFAAGRRDFTHSKVMAWVAFDRAVKGGGAVRARWARRPWRAARDEVHREVCERGFDAERNTFTQYYGSKALDASTLMIPLVGFLPPSDPRVVGTVDAIQRELLVDGLVLRYASEQGVDGLPAGRGGVPPLLVLARRQPVPDRTCGRGHRAVRAPGRARQRRRPDRRGVRPGGEADARELPAGVHPRVARQHRVQPRPRHRAPPPTAPTA